MASKNMRKLKRKLLAGHPITEKDYPRNWQRFIDQPMTGIGCSDSYLLAQKLKEQK